VVLYVLRNGCESRWFNVCNGVKQGGVLSPVLFCIYIAVLLLSLQRTGLGCYIGHMFVGVLAYADDLVLLAPTPHAMRSMLQCCEEYAKEFEVLFNAKSKCIISRPREVAHRANFVHDVTFIISGSVIENVDS